MAAEPVVQQSDDIYTITWSTEDNYPSNEIVMKSNASKYPDVGVGADSAYDFIHNVYIHTASFRLADGYVSSEIPVFPLVRYTYQVQSSGLKSMEPLILFMKSKVPSIAQRAIDLQDWQVKTGQHFIRT